MAVTEKCDVYSFGVLTLEIVMGKHPGELISALNSGSIQSIRYEDVLDSRLSIPTSQEIADKLALAVNLAIPCVASNPESRPTMRKAVKLLEIHAHGEELKA